MRAAAQACAPATQACAPAMQACAPAMQTLPATQACAPATQTLPPLDMVRAIAETLDRFNNITAITGAATEFKGPLSHRERRAVMVATGLLLEYSRRAKNPEDPAKCIPGILLTTCPLIAVRIWDMEEIKIGKGGKIAKEAIATLDDESAQAAGKYLLGLQAFAGNIGGDAAMHSVLLATKRREKNPITGAAISLLVSALKAADGAGAPKAGAGAGAPKLRDDVDLMNCYVIARVRCTAAAVG